MKKLYVSSFLVMMAVFLAYCHTAKKATSAAPVYTYEASIQPIITSSCAPCHIPSKGGNKEAYDNYASVKKDIDEILHRIQLNPGEKGFMPMKHPKLSSDTVTIFQKWKEAGLAEK